MSLFQAGKTTRRSFMAGTAGRLMMPAIARAEAPKQAKGSIATQPYAARVFDPTHWRADQPLRVVMIGTDFQLSVWEALLRIPMGRACTYSSIAASIGAPNASRAVGAAVGANPMSFVVPCHRAIGKSGALTGYHWGLTRKRAILGWEAGQVAS